MKEFDEEKLALKHVYQLYKETFKENPEKGLVAYGRLEISGNHTDHEGGHCVVGTCSLSLKGMVGKSDDGMVHFLSEGFSLTPFDFSASNLKKEEDENSSVSLIKGVMFYLKEHGYKVGGWKAVSSSNIFSGAGVSSSAAFELYVGTAMSALYNDGKIPPMVLAKAGQYAENVYFGKASGLLDQCGSAFGGLNYLDFSDPNDPKVTRLPAPSFPFYVILVNPGLSHARLNKGYSSIPEDMQKIASYFGKKRLIEVIEKDVLAKKDELIKEFGILAYKRALHFYGEEKRVELTKDAVVKGDGFSFIKQQRDTQASEKAYLENTMYLSRYDYSPQQAVDRAKLFLKNGSARVMGGGFFGSIICFVPFNERDAFVEGMKRFYNENNIREVYIPLQGSHAFDPKEFFD